MTLSSIAMLQVKNVVRVAELTDVELVELLLSVNALQLEDLNDDDDEPLQAPSTTGRDVIAMLGDC